MCLRRRAAPSRLAATHRVEGTTGWIIDNNEVSYNGEYGIRIGNSTQITNNNVHHNERLNIAGAGTTP